LKLNRARDVWYSYVHMIRVNRYCYWFYFSLPKPADGLRAI